MKCKKLVALSLALTMTLALAGCQQAAKPTPAPTAAPAASAAPASEAPQETPFAFERDITLVNPYEAGGTSDIPSRVYADYISKNMGGRMMNVNCIAGSGGALGAQEVMNAKPDGYTLLVAPAGYAMNYAKGGLDWTYEAFEPVCLYVTSVLCVAVRADSGYETWADLVEAVKANPSKINMGIATSGLPQFSVYAIEAHEGIKFNTVDIGGSSVKATELLAGRVDVMIDSLSGVQAYVDSGDFKVLSVFSDARHPAFPDAPTMAELEYTEEETSVMSQVFGVWAPKGTDREVIDAVADLFEAAAADADVNNQLNEKCYTATFMDTDDYSQNLKYMYDSFVAFAKQYLGK